MMTDSEVFLVEICSNWFKSIQLRQEAFWSVPAHHGP